MAYTFDQINGLMGGGTGQQKADIFSGGGSQGGQDQNSGAAPQQQNSTSQAPVQDSSAQPQAPKPVQGAGATQSDILKKNSFAAQPSFTNDVKSSIGKAQTDLQNEADTYMSSQQAKAQPQVSTGDLDKALSGDAAATQAAQGYLYNNKPTADMFQSGVNTDFSKLDQLNDQNGLQQYLRQKGPETYNQGLASLDAQLLSRDPQYQTGLKEAKAQRDALQQLKQDYSTNEQSRAQSALDQSTTTGKQNVTDYLKGQGSAWNQNNLQEIQAENAARAGLRSNPNQTYINSQVQNAYAELAKNSPELAQYLPKSSIVEGVHTNNADPASYQSNWANQFYQVGGDVDSAATDTDAARFNQLQKLLNTGGTMQAANTGNRESIDYNGLKNKMVQLAQQAKADEEARAAAPKASVATYTGG